MDAGLRSRAKEIFLDALEEPLERRAAYVARATEGDPDLSEAVAHLLGGHRRADSIDGWIPSPPPKADGLAVGDVLGSYELLAELDAGASGRIFRARQQGLEREVALKVPNTGRFASAEEVARFRREAEAIARLDHPGIVPVIDVDEADDRHFFSMKLVEGGSLADRKGEFVDPDAAVALIETVARAVHHAHQRGILHRDLKPSNILLDRAGQPFVADFGIAARLEPVAGEEKIMVAGTPAYMAPEQAVEGGELTTATDVWALGCVLFELLEGAPPFRGSGVTDSLRRASEDPTPPLAETRTRRLRTRGRDLEAIVRHCLEKAPADRYGSARSLADDLARWRGRFHVAVRSPSPLERVQLRLMRQPWTSSLAVLVGLLAVVIATTAPIVGLELSRRLDRAETAEGIASTRLRAALLAQAEATRRSTAPGRRERALRNLAEAAAIQPGGDLRDEAVRALASVDAVPFAELEIALDGVSVVCVDDEGRRLILSHRDGGGRALDLITGETLWTLHAPRYRFWSGAFGPNGERLLLRAHGNDPSQGAELHLYDLQRREIRHTWSDGVSSARFDFSPDGERFVVLSDDRRLTVYDARTVESLLEVDLPALHSDVIFSPRAGEIYVALGLDGQLVRVDAQSGAWETLGEPFGVRLSDIDVDASGERLLVGAYGTEAFVVNIASGAVTTRLRGHGAEIPKVSFVSDELAATTAWDGLVRIWDIESAEQVLEWAGRIAHGRGQRSGVITSQTGDRMQAHRFAPSQVARVLSGHAGKSPRALACPPQAPWIATGAVDGLRLWDPRTGELFAHVATEPILALAATPDGERLFATWAGALVEFDVARLLAGRAADPTTILSGVVEDAVLSDDGRILAVRRSAEVVDILDATTAPPSPLRSVEGPGRIARLDLSPDGSRLCAGAWRGHGARVWDVDTGEVLMDRVPEARQLSACFDALGERLFTSTPDRLQAWSREGDELASVGVDHSRSFQTAGAIDADPAGRWLAAVVDRETVELRRVDGLHLDLRLWLDGSPFQTVEFIPETPLLVTATSDGRAVVWDLERVATELEGLGLPLHRDVERRRLPGRSSR